MFRVKICGITNVDDALAVANAGADAIGLNFFKNSCRFLETTAASRIASITPDGVMRVGVFVNHSADEITKSVEEVGLDCVQLHGDESPTLLAELPKTVPVIRAFRCGMDGLLPLAKYVEECRALGRVPDAVLIDADASEEYGGSGNRADWAQITNDRNLLHGMTLILAGGLSPGNVAAAIAMIRPNGVDVASGVEAQPGHKDSELVRRFIFEARTALSRY